MPPNQTWELPSWPTNLLCAPAFLGGEVCSRVEEPKGGNSCAAFANRRGVVFRLAEALPE
jgi:hypothetical protein